ncbi:hypothetical protein MMC06_002627 [Schaereria dolodes]|nr:hypothetical protein [Schaereria dolodes]
MVPDLNRWASDWIIDQCVAGGRAVGGFHTRAFKNVIDIVTKPGMNPGDPLPPRTCFFTVSITGPGGLAAPGDYDTTIPVSLYFARGENGKPPPQSDPYYEVAVKMSRDQARDDSHHTSSLKQWWKYL